MSDYSEDELVKVYVDDLPQPTVLHPFAIIDYNFNEQNIAPRIAYLTTVEYLRKFAGSGNIKTRYYKEQKIQNGVFVGEPEYVVEHHYEEELDDDSTQTTYMPVPYTISQLIEYDDTKQIDKAVDVIKNHIITLPTHEAIDTYLTLQIQNLHRISQESWRFSMTKDKRRNFVVIQKIIEALKLHLSIHFGNKFDSHIVNILSQQFESEPQESGKTEETPDPPFGEGINMIDRQMIGVDYHTVDVAENDEIQETHENIESIESDDNTVKEQAHIDYEIEGQEIPKAEVVFDSDEIGKVTDSQQAIINFKFKGDDELIEKIYSVKVGAKTLFKQDKITLDRFKVIMTQENELPINDQISFNVETQQAAYIFLDKLQSYFDNLNGESIEKAGCFYSKRASKLDKKYFRQAKEKYLLNKYPKEKSIIDDAFDEL